MTKLINDRQKLSVRKELRSRATEAEKVFWKAYRLGFMHGMKVRRQVSIGPYVVDFYIPGKRLVIELDGDPHFTEEGIGYDRFRTSFLLEQGFRVMRFTNNEIRENLEDVIEQIASAAEHLT